ncbi:MAG: hypothetical protein MUE41_02035, partial [Gemmatimonadaceae bacterium]|nr:hypothetical protein [Gemmatimonadaceae bacterium]
ALFGTVALVTGLAVGLRTPKQVATLERMWAASPAALLRAEVPRMQRVNANWPRYLALWAVCAVVGLVLRFGVPREWAHGVGPALLLVGAIGVVIDGFAERRAREYTQALEAAQAAVGRALH